LHIGFAEIHCVPGNVAQPPFDAITVAGPGAEKPVVPGGAAISCHTWLPVEMTTEVGTGIAKGHVGVGVGVGVGVRVGVGVTVGVLVAVAVLVGLGVGVALGGRVAVGVRVGVGVGVAVNVGGVTGHETIRTYPLRVPLRSMPVAVPPPPL
jgi:hypothetical protein